MENTYNIIHVDFKGERIAQKYNLWQYDYNQILQISGLSLPATVEIHFSLTGNTGETETRVATTKNGITQVQIPNELLRNDGKSGNYSIFAFIYVVDEDSGNTEYEIILHVKSRPAPGEVGEDPDEPHILDEAVNAVNAAAERAETAKMEARSAASSAETAAEAARKSAEEVTQEKNTAISAIQERQAAAEKAIMEAADVLTGQINKAETAGSELKATAEDAGRKKKELEASIQDAVTVKGKVDNSTELAETAKKNLDKSVQDASAQKSELDKTVARAEELDTSLGEKISEATQLKSNLQTAGEKATQDIHTAGEEERSQMTQIAEQFQESIDALTPDDSVVDGKAWTSKKIIDTLCPEFQETGNPVTCYPVAGYPLDVTVSWEPVQPGSGDPYPGGGGKNLLDISRCVASENEPYGLHVTIDKDVIKIDGVPNSEVINEGEYQFAVAYATQTELQGKGYKVTAFAEKGIVYRAWGLRTADEPQLAISARLTPGVNTNIQVRLMVSKSESTVYYPYENIRPIHGRDNVTIERCGKNISPPYTKNGIVKLNTPIMRETKATLSFNGTATKENLQFNIYVHYYDDRFAYCKFSGKTVAGTTRYILTANLPAGTQILRLYVSDSPFEKINDWQLTLDFRSPETYEQYNAQVDAVQLPQEGIYGGTLDVISGIVTADWTVRTFDGTETWNSWGVDNITKGITGFYTYDVDDYDYAYTSDAYASHTISTAESWGGGAIGFGFANENSTRYFFMSVYNELLDNTEKAIESWKAYLAEQYAAGTPVQIAYKVAEPVSFRAETEQIQALKGINNILTDADTVTVSGREDPVHYIDKKFAELSAAIVSSASEAE